MTSPNGARLLFEAMEDAGRDARALSQAQVAAIGPGTARALRERGVIADVVPERSIAEALVEALGDVPVEGKPVLVARAAEARDVLPDALRERGAEVDVVALYETVRETPAPEEIERAMDADYVTFTSSSTVKNFLEVTGGRVPEGARIVSIGPVTLETARDAGIDGYDRGRPARSGGADRRIGGGCACLRDLGWGVSEPAAVCRVAWGKVAGLTVLCALAVTPPAPAGVPLPAPAPIGSGPGRDFDVDCRYVSRGEPGAAGNELRISAGRRDLAFVDISDRDGKLRLRGTDRCKGRAKPRLDNIDSIALNLDKSRFAFVSISTAESALGPGATREDDGSSEIEVSSGQLRFPLGMQLGGSDDNVTTGPIGEESVGTNLTAGVDGDIDVRTQMRAGLEILLGDGDDTFTSEAGQERGGDITILGEVSAFGDSGDDTLTGGPGFDFLGGGSGSDVIAGRGSFDFIQGGEDDDELEGNGSSDFIDAEGGNDDVLGGAGEDFIEANDAKSDRVDCGDDKDFAAVDRRRDNYENCERLRTGVGRAAESRMSARQAETADRARRLFRSDGS